MNNFNGVASSFISNSLYLFTQEVTANSLASLINQAEKIGNTEFRLKRLDAVYKKFHEFPIKLWDKSVEKEFIRLMITYAPLDARTNTVIEFALCRMLEIKNDFEWREFQTLEMLTASLDSSKLLPMIKLADFKIATDDELFKKCCLLHSAFRAKY